jgi:hypothetical protein
MERQSNGTGFSKGASLGQDAAEACSDAPGSHMLSFVKAEEQSVADAHASSLVRLGKVQESIQVRREAYEGAAENLRKPKIQEAIQSPRMKCRVCGKPSERKRRSDHSWFYYDRCRRCRREILRSKPEPLSITDTRLLHLLQALYGHLWLLKEQGFRGAPKKTVMQRLRSLLGVLQEE